MRCAIYCRLSQDRSGEGLGVERQRQDCRNLAQQRGGIAISEYVDNDTSATKKKPRPQYGQLLQAAARGEIDTIITWSLDRLVRRMADLEELVEICDKHNVAILMVRGSDLDLSSPSGRLVARLLGAVARHEVDAKADRQRREAQQRAERGQPTGGRRPFGYTETGEQLHPGEHEQATKMYDLLLTGRSLSGIARDLNAAGFTTTTGGPWAHHAVRQFLLNPRNAGFRTFRGEILGDSDRPALVSEEVYLAAMDILADPGRRTNERGGARRWLGTGLYECGRCGTAMRSTYRDRRIDGTARRTYRCPGCKMSRIADPVDETVVEVVAARLNRSDVDDMVHTPGEESPAAHTELRALRERRRGALQLFTDGELTASELRQVRARLDARIAELEQSMVSSARSHALAVLLAQEQPGDAWRVMPDVDRRQAVVRSLCTVRLLPVGSGRRVFDPASVQVSWVGAAG